MKTSFENNGAHIIMYKSSRRNAIASDVITVYHLISHGDDKKIADERIIEQLINTLEKVAYWADRFSGHLEVSSYVYVGKDVRYEAVHGVYTGIEQLSYHNNRERVYSFEQVVNSIYCIYALVYPYNTIALKSVHDNIRVRHMLQKYYHSENGKQ